MCNLSISMWLWLAGRGLGSRSSETWGSSESNACYDFTSGCGPSSHGLPAHGDLERLRFLSTSIVWLSRQSPWASGY
ncbi:hypothetical protein GQ54DRAFT_1964 [Martensiomyces pterosporus]|nr:hypothetical protein GQ54DRAFT_1964 [Martensiomyces pterosporus]